MDRWSDKEDVYGTQWHYWPIEDIDHDTIWRENDDDFLGKDNHPEVNTSQKADDIKPMKVHNVPKKKDERDR